MFVHRLARPGGTWLAVFAMLLFGLVVAAPASAQEVTPARLAGDDRVATAAEVAEFTYADGTDVALLGRADDYPDTLAAAALAGQAGGPVLLAHPERLPERTTDALEALDVERVYVLGGPSAIGPEVVDALSADGYDVTRLGGDDRYETAAEVARETVALGDTNRLVGDARTVFIAYGGSFEDALAAGAPASAAIIPTLLTAHDDLPDATVDAIRELEFEYAYVLGGPEAISDAVVSQLEELDMGTQRIAGQTAQGTAASIAENFSGLLQGPVTVLARGDLYADALAAGPHAGAIDAPIVLTDDPSTLSEPTRSYLANPPRAIDAVRAIGGDQAITPATLAAAVDAAAGDGVATEQTYLVAPQEALTVTAPGTADFAALRRYDGGAITEPALDLALFPCELVDVTGAGTDTFTDDNDDGLADGRGRTDSGNAAIAVLNGTDVPDDQVKTDVVVRDGRVTWRVASVAGPDCTVPVIWDDANGNAELDVGGSDVGEVPVEPYGVGKVTFR